MSHPSQRGERLEACVVQIANEPAGRLGWKKECWSDERVGGWWETTSAVFLSAASTLGRPGGGERYTSG